MKYLMPLLTFTLVAGMLQAQQTSQPSSPGTTSVERVQVDAVLQRYLTAYQRRSIDLLLEVWPDLQKDKKQYGQLKHHLGDASLADEKMEVTPREIQSTSEGILVHVQRTETYSKIEVIHSVFGGSWSSTMPVQDTSSQKRQNKKETTKQDEVWITMHHTGDTWTIASITDKKPM